MSVNLVCSRFDTDRPLFVEAVILGVLSLDRALEPTSVCVRRVRVLRVAKARILSISAPGYRGQISSVHLRV